MITYGESLAWCVKHAAVFRFISRRERGEFYAANMDIPGNLAMEMAITVAGKTIAAHYPLDASKEPSNAVAVALIGCVTWFAEREAQGQSLVVGGVN
jgi:hypothetical protein